MNLPLFAGFSTKNKIAEALLLEEKAQDDLDATANAVAEATERAFYDLQSAQAQVTALLAAEVSGRSAFEGTQLAYRAGVRLNLDVLNAQSQLFMTQRDLAKARYDVVMRSLKLRAAAGQLRFDDIIAVNKLEPAKPVAVAQPVVLQPPPASAPNADCAQFPLAVESWLKAWNRKDVAGYLSTYSSNFVPGNAMDRKQWEALRTRRISKQGDFQITIGKMTLVRCDARAAEVVFTQEFGSAHYTDSVSKTLVLENLQSVWKIIRETVTQGRGY